MSQAPEARERTCACPQLPSPAWGIAINISAEHNGTLKIGGRARPGVTLQANRQRVRNCNISRRGCSSEPLGNTAKKPYDLAGADGPRSFQTGRPQITWTWGYTGYNTPAGPCPPLRAALLPQPRPNLTSIRERALIHMQWPTAIPRTSRRWCRTHRHNH